MGRRFAGLLFVLCGLLTAAGSVRGDVIVTLEAFATGGQPITGPVAPGTDVVVDILLAADAASDPVEDVRLIQFDFEDTDSGIQIGAFTWNVDENVYLSFPGTPSQLRNVTAILHNTGPGLLRLTTEPLKVGTVELTVDGSGTLDLINPDNTDENFGADVRAGFGFTEPQVRFNFPAGNLQGGTLAFSVSGTGGGDPGDGDGDPGDGDDDDGGLDPPTQDFDGDGVGDAEDAFPNDPGETRDTNEDGVGDNSDPDDDGDGVEDEEDEFPLDSDEVSDSNGDGVGDNEDPDDDGDNVPDDGDAFPDDPDEAMDSDDDGIGNNADTDDDNDGVADADDAFPLDPDESGDDGDDVAPPSSPRMCGAGMLGSSIFMLMGLGLMAYRPGRRG